MAGQSFATALGEAFQPAVSGAEATWQLGGGGPLVLGTGNTIDFLNWYVPPASQAGTVVSTTITLPRDARIQSAVFDLSADAVANASLASVAQVTATSPTSDSFKAAASIDFGAMVTVGGIISGGLLSVALGIDSVSRWSGTSWTFVANGQSFADVATQRLLVQSTSTTTTGAAFASSLTTNAGVALPVVPTGLELVVDGRSAWFERQGSSARQPGDAEPAPPPSASASAYRVERTQAVRDAFTAAVAAAPADATDVSLTVSLRATTPGALTLTPHVTALRVYPVTFVPEGPSRSLELPEENLVSIDVTPPQATTVHEVALTLRGQFGPQRVVPPVGPVLTAAARLVLTGGRTVLVGLPRALIAPLASLSGVRLRLQVPKNADGTPGTGGQVTGRLLAAAAPGRPGDPLPGGDLTPLSVTAEAAAWYTLAFTKPVKVPAPTPPAAPPAGGAGVQDDGVGAWLELQPSYGEIECLLTSAPTSDPATPGAPLRRRLAGGATTALTTISALGDLYGAVRVVGLPDRDATLPAVTLRVPGSADALGATPTGDALGIALTLSTPVDATTPVSLEAVCAAAGSVTFEEVKVTYRPSEVPS